MSKVAGKQKRIDSIVSMLEKKNMIKHKIIKIEQIKLNPNNPRLIKDDKFLKLVQSIKDFPEMLNIRPIVVNQDMTMIGIYKITSPSGRIYIGQSVNIDNRISSYKNLKCKNQTKLYRSLLKYTFENHTFEVIEECSVEILNERERHWQDFYNSGSKKGLNCKLTKTNDKVGLLSNETKIKIGAGNKGKKVSLESRKKMSIAKKNISEETRQKFRNKKISIETKTKLSLFFKGRKIKESTRLNLLENNGKSKKVICTETLKIYNSANQCAIENNIKHKTLCNQLSGISKNKTTFKYV